MTRRLLLLACVLVLGGCKEKGAGSGGGSQVLVTVNGVSLLRSDVETDVYYRMEAMRASVPSNRVAEVQDNMRSAAIDQFIARTVLLTEADRRGIKVTPEEEKAAFDKIKSGLPPGASLDDVMKKSALGEKRMKEEVLVGVRINKLLVDALGGNMTVTDAEVEDFRKQHASELAQPERVHARHILLAVKADADEAARAERKKAAEAVRAELLKGGDFATLAARYSDCPSKQRGGDLGVFRRGQMVKAFDDAAFSRETNAIGPVLETKFGYHIVQVLEHKPAGDASRDEVMSAIRNQKKQRAMQEYIQGLRAKADIKFGAAKPVKP